MRVEGSEHDGFVVEVEADEELDVVFCLRGYNRSVQGI